MDGDSEYTPKYTYKPSTVLLLKPWMIQSAYDLARQGNFCKVIGRSLGIKDRTWAQWMDRGKREPESLHGQLYAAIQRGIAECERDNVLVVREDGEKNPENAKWLLEKRFKERWGKYAGEMGELKRRCQRLERMVEHLESMYGVTDSGMEAAPLQDAERPV